MNKAFLIGNLTRDPELRTLPSGVSVCTFTIAINRKFVNQQGVREADFLNIVAWRQLGETCARYLSKGRKVGVTGSIQTRSYDAQDGSKRYVTEIIADSVEAVGGRDEAAAGRPRDNGPTPPPEMPGVPSGGFTEVDDDELPF